MIKKYRSRLDIYKEIIEACGPVEIDETTVVRRVNSNSFDIKPYLRFLIDRGMLDEKRHFLNRRLYYISTEKGNEYVRDYSIFSNRYSLNSEVAKKKRRIEGSEVKRNGGEKD